MPEVVSITKNKDREDKALIIEGITNDVIAAAKLISAEKQKNRFLLAHKKQPQGTDDLVSLLNIKSDLAIKLARLKG